MKLKYNAGLVFQDSHRYRVLKAGRRFGKSREFVAEILRTATYGNTTSDEYAEIWYIAPTYRAAKRIFWKVLRGSIPWQWVAKINESELSIMLRNGLLISLKGADHPDGLRGNALVLALFDEYDYINPACWQEVIRPMLSTTGGKAIFAGTPDGKKQLSSLYHRGQSDDPRDSDWSSYHFTTFDGGWVSQKEIDDMRADMDDQTFRQEILAEEILASGAVYYAFSQANIKPAPPELKQGHLCAGMDFNIAPWMSATVFAVKGEDMHIVDDIIIPRGNTYQMVDEIRHRYGTRLVDIYPDPAGRHLSTSAVVGTSDFTILEKAGFKLHSRLSTTSIKNGINAVNSRLCSQTKQRHLFVDPSLRRRSDAHPPRTIDCLEQHAYKIGTSVPDSDIFGHLCFAGDTMVETPSGLVRIDSLPASGLIRSWDGGFVEYTGGGIEIKNSVVLRVEMNNGSIVRCTPDHKFLTADGWVEAKDLVGKNILDWVSYREEAQRGRSGTKNLVGDLWPTIARARIAETVVSMMSRDLASGAGSSSLSTNTVRQDSAGTNAPSFTLRVSRITEEKQEKVYCPTTPDGCFGLPCGAIVSNCDSLRYATEYLFPVRDSRNWTQ